MTRRAFGGFFASCLLLGASFGLAQPVSVTYQDGLLSVSCSNAPLSEVFEAIEREANVELTLEDPVKSKTLTADLVAVPVAMAVQQLLEGAGVNYVVMMDPQNWDRVGKIFVGAGGGGPARAAAPLSRRPAFEPPEPVEAMEEDYYDDQQALEALEALENMSDEFMEDPDQMNPDEFGDQFGDEFGPEAFPTQPGAAAPPSYLPPTPTFPRSRFTPGLPSGSPQPQQVPAVPQEPQLPPEVYPYTDPFGRPIPVPPEVNQQRRQRQQQQNRE